MVEKEGTGKSPPFEIIQNFQLLQLFQISNGESQKPISRRSFPDELEMRVLLAVMRVESRVGVETGNKAHFDLLRTACSTHFYPQQLLLCHIGLY
jgi:hypothetical protein